MAVTGVYGFPYLEMEDPPNIPEVTQGISEGVETELVRVEGRIDDITEEQDAVWPTYTPVWSSSGTQPVVNNGTLTGSYKRIGQTVLVRISLTLGSTSTVGSGVYRISLPVAPKMGSLLTAVFKDSSAGSARYGGPVEIIAETTTGDNMRINTTGGTTVWASTTPVVPANGDQLLISGPYEAA